MTHSLRINFKGSGLTVTPDPTTKEGKQLSRDMRHLAELWMNKLEVNLKPEAIEEAAFEVLHQGTLDYIDALEGVLEWLQAQDDTPDDVLERIEKVLR